MMPGQMQPWQMPSDVGHNRPRPTLTVGAVTQAGSARASLCNTAPGAPHLPIFSRRIAAASCTPGGCSSLFRVTLPGRSDQLTLP